MANTCPTCFESLVSDSQNYIVSTQCGHLFHTNCVQSWMDTGNQTCPQCRSIISKDKLIRIYLQSTESDIQNPQKTVPNSTIAPSNPETTQNRCNICKLDFVSKEYLMLHLKSKIHLDKYLEVYGLESRNTSANDENRQDSGNTLQHLSSNSATYSRQANSVSLNSQSNSARTGPGTTRTNQRTTTNNEPVIGSNQEKTDCSGCCCFVFFLLLVWMVVCVAVEISDKEKEKNWLNEKNSVSLIINN